jgi:hypothetical protein
MPTSTLGVSLHPLEMEAIVGPARHPADPYASTVLIGQYPHIPFGDAELDEQADPASLTPVMVRWESAGSSYVLHHTMVHAVVTQPYTVSLVIRGPAIMDRFLVMDRGAGESWWQYGDRRRMPPPNGCRPSGWLN